MDLGFGVVLDKFEEYFGKRATRWMLILIGLAIVAGCISIIWTWLIAPILTFLESPQWARTIWSLVLAALGIGAGIAVGLSLTAALNQWRRSRKLTQLLRRATRVSERVDDRLRETEQLIGKSEKLLEKAGGTIRDSGSLLLDIVSFARRTVGADQTLTKEARAALAIEFDRMEEEVRQLAEKDVGKGKRKRAVRRAPKADGARGGS